MNYVSVKTYKEPKFNIKEILRYSGSKADNSDIIKLIEECIKEIKDKLIYKVCFIETDVKILENEIDFGFCKTKSKNLSFTLSGCEKAIIFCATIGLNIDREILKYLSISPSKAVVFQAIGAERIEELCNEFQRDMKEIYNNKGLFLTPRFSPGYGDLKLDFQKDIFSLLDCTRKIGVSLNESLVISPSKSVTAIIGLSKKDCGYEKNKCISCDKKECTFRQ